MNTIFRNPPEAEESNSSNSTGVELVEGGSDTGEINPQPENIVPNDERIFNDDPIIPKTPPNPDNDEISPKDASSAPQKNKKNWPSYGTVHLATSRTLEVIIKKF